MCSQLHFLLMSMCRTASYHLSHLSLLHEVVQYMRLTPFLKHTLLHLKLNLLPPRKKIQMKNFIRQLLLEQYYIFQTNYYKNLIFEISFKITSFNDVS